MPAIVDENWMNVHPTMMIAGNIDGAGAIKEKLYMK